ncbi:MAG: hypothetical protein IKM15_02930 [Peptococcaceae bacterium]|nr:hypothetical protein [Peptococcaceae bacterium]
MKEIRQVYYAERKRQAKQRLVKIVTAFVLLGISFYSEKIFKTAEKVVDKWK